MARYGDPGLSEIQQHLCRQRGASWQLGLCTLRLGGHQHGATEVLSRARLRWDAASWQGAASSGPGAGAAATSLLPALTGAGGAVLGLCLPLLAMVGALVAPGAS